MILHYKGFDGSVEFSVEDDCWHGKIINSSDLVTYESETLDEIVYEFKYSVDCYLDRWDQYDPDDGAPEPSQETKNRAIQIYKAFRIDCKALFMKDLPEPVEGVCADGSIDLHWKNDQVEILVNVTENCDPTYYCDNYENHTAKGKFDFLEAATPLMWIALFVAD